MFSGSNSNSSFGVGGGGGSGGFMDSIESTILSVSMSAMSPGVQMSAASDTAATAQPVPPTINTVTTIITSTSTTESALESATSSLTPAVVLETPQVDPDESAGETHQTYQIEAEAKTDVLEAAIESVMASTDDEMPLPPPLPPPPPPPPPVAEVASAEGGEAGRLDETSAAESETVVEMAEAPASADETLNNESETTVLETPTSKPKRTRIRKPKAGGGGGGAKASRVKKDLDASADAMDACAPSSPNGVDTDEVNNFLKINYEPKHFGRILA